MKKILMFLVITMVLIFASTASASFIVGDIDFSNLDQGIYLHAEQIGNYIEKIHAYPNESIKIVEIIAFSNNFVKTVSYFKDGELFVWENVPGRGNLYLRVTDLSPETIKAITGTLKKYLK